MPQHWKILAHFVTWALLVESSLAIDCYQCAGTDNKSPFQCNEFLGRDVDLNPEPCDNVYGAKYCVKHTGRFEAFSIDCYQCSSSEMLECADGMIRFGGLQPQNCNHVFEAQYCIKSTSLGGGIGTKRFCSSLDLGNYCNFVRQPGDVLNYRTCIYTCTGDGCNPGNKVSPMDILSSVILIFSVGLLRTVVFR